MAAVAITAPSRGNRLRRLAVERAMTEVAFGAHAGRGRVSRSRERDGRRARRALAPAR